MTKLKLNKLFIFVLLTFVIVLTSCSRDGNDNEPPIEEPSYEYVDKSNLEYVDLLDEYKKTDWEARWIWDERSISDSYVVFRKEFNLDEALTNRTAYIAAESKYFMWINEELIVYDGGMKRGPTIYDTYYDSITIPHLKSGKNNIVIMVIYNGRSSDSSIDPEQAGLLFELDLGKNKVLSDTSFKVKRLTEYKNQSLLKGKYPNYPQSSMLGERNVYYDARDSIGDFTKDDFDDSNWDTATIVGKPGAKPFNDLYLNVAPQIKFGEIKDFENASEYINKPFTENTIIELDLPINRQFSYYFEIESVEGLELLMYTNTYLVLSEYNFKDTYITKNGIQTYENYPWRSGSQLIIEVPAGVTFKKLSYRESGYNSENTGSFESSNEDLNILWEKALYTLNINMRDTFMDCPDRERAQYFGDAINQADLALYSLDANSHLMIKKAILGVIGWTKDDGAIPSRLPSIKPHELPVQSLGFITAVYNYYLFTNDEDTVRKFYTVAINYLKLWELKDNGLIKYRDGSWSWVDWGIGTDGEVVQNSWYYYALTSLEKLAQELNIVKDNNFINTRKNSIKDNFAAVFKKGDGFTSKTQYDDRANALAVVSGLATEEYYEGIINILTSTYQASPFMERVVLEALCVMGEYDKALNRMVRRYGDMIEDEGTTLWELWDKDAGTINHGWSGGPLLIMSKYFAGIKALKPGFTEYEIKPVNMFESLTTVVDTGKGLIELTISTNQIKVKTISGVGYLHLNNSFGMVSSVTGGSFEELNTLDGYKTFKLTEAKTYVFTLSN